MKRKLLLTLFLTYLCANSFGQDSLLQVEFTFFPIKYTKEYETIKKDYYNLYNDYNFRYNIGPSVLITFPVFSKLSLTSGVLFFSRSAEFTFEDSVITLIDPNYIYKISKDYNEIRIPVNIDYCLFSRKKINIFASSGFDIVPKYKIIEMAYYYPDKYIGYIYKKNNWFAFDNTLHINLTLKYYYLKHFGISIRPFAGYNIAKGKETRFVCGIGFGICYK